MRRVLVTGAGGFVGRALCEYLAGKGWLVRGTYRAGHPEVPGAVSIEWRQIGSIGPETDWSAAVEGVDVVVHAAAVAHRISRRAQVPDSVYDEVNHLGTLRLAEAARHAKVGRLVFVSSIGAVVDSSETIVDEATPCAPVTAYGRSKLAAERALAKVLAKGHCDWCALRPPLLYGADSPGNMGRLLKLTKLPLPLPFAGIRNRRSFLFVGNLTSAIGCAMDHPAASREVFCVADNEVLSTPELVRALANVSGRRIRQVRASPGVLAAVGRLGDVVEKATGRSPGFGSETIRKLAGSLPVSAARLRSRCGWTPPYSLQEGLGLTVGKPSAR